jgi:hypothetical protein
VVTLTDAMRCRGVIYVWDFVAAAVLAQHEPYRLQLPPAGEVALSRVSAQQLKQRPPIPPPRTTG